MAEEVSIPEWLRAQVLLVTLRGSNSALALSTFVTWAVSLSLL